MVYLPPEIYWLILSFVPAHKNAVMIKETKIKREEEHRQKCERYGCVKKFPFHFLILRDWSTRLWLKEYRTRSELKREKYKRLMEFWTNNEKHKAFHNWFNDNVREPIAININKDYWASEAGMREMEARGYYDIIGRVSNL